MRAPPQAKVYQIGDHRASLCKLPIYARWPCMVSPEPKRIRSFGATGSRPVGYGLPTKPVNVRSAMKWAKSSGSQQPSGVIAFVPLVLACRETGTRFVSLFSKNPRKFMQLVT